MEFKLGDKFNQRNHPISHVFVWTELEQQKSAIANCRSIWAIDNIENYGLKEVVLIQYSHQWLQIQNFSPPNLLFGLTQGAPGDLYITSDSTGVTFYPLIDQDTPLAFLRSTDLNTVWHELCHMIVPELYQSEGTHGRCAISVDWLGRNLSSMHRLRELAKFVQQILTAVHDGFLSVSDYLTELEPGGGYGS